MTRKFTPAEDEWRTRLRMLPNTVRQELVSRQLQSHLPPAPARVLDVGCGQGTQALRLAQAGYEVTGVDHSAAMLDDFRRALADQPASVRNRVHLVHGDAEHLTSLFEPASFNVIVCHGVLMYQADPIPVLRTIADVLEPGGVLSLLVRNADVLALYHGLRGEWSNALAAFGSTHYLNRIGVEARADHLSEIVTQLGAVGLSLRQWYGVLCFSEFAAMESEVPDSETLAEIVACEEAAGQTDPYRQIAALLHLVVAL